MDRSKRILFPFENSVYISKSWNFSVSSERNSALYFVRLQKIGNNISRLNSPYANFFAVTDFADSAE